MREKEEEDKDHKWGGARGQEMKQKRWRDIDKQVYAEMIMKHRDFFGVDAQERKKLEYK